MESKQEAIKQLKKQQPQKTRNVSFVYGSEWYESSPLHYFPTHLIHSWFKHLELAKKPETIHDKINQRIMSQPFALLTDY